MLKDINSKKNGAYMIDNEGSKNFYKIMSN